MNSLEQLCVTLNALKFRAMPRMNSRTNKPAVTVMATGEDGKSCFIDRQRVKGEWQWVIGKELQPRASQPASQANPAITPEMLAQLIASLQAK